MANAINSLEMIQAKYGIEKEEAEKQVEDFDFTFYDDRK